MIKSDHSIEFKVDMSKFEEILKELCSYFPDNISFSDLVSIVKLGFELDGKAAMWTNNTQRAVFKPLNFLLELLPAVRTGKLTFSAFKGILEAKSEVRLKTYHN